MNSAEPKTCRQHDDAPAGRKIGHHRGINHRHDKTGGKKENNEDNKLRHKDDGDNVAECGGKNNGGKGIENGFGN